MPGRIKRSAALFKSSWAVLKTHRSLLLLPIISALMTLLVVASFAAPVATALMLDEDLRNEVVEEVASTNESTTTTKKNTDAEGATTGTPVADDGALSDGWKIAGVLYLLGFYITTSFVMVFFNAALIAAANEHFEGRPSGLGVGLRLASKRLPQIIGWSIVAALLGTILRMISERSGIAGRIAIGLVGMAWSIASYFAVPAVVLEGVGPITAVKRSVETLRSNWGESLSIAVGFSLIGGLVLFLAIPATLIGGAMVGYAFIERSHDAVGIGVLGGIVCLAGLVATIGWSILEGTLKGITQAALYRFAKTDAVPEGFAREDLQAAFQTR